MRASDTPKITEKVWRAQVVSLAKQLGWEVYFTWTSIHSPAGFPDLILVRENADGTVSMIFAELKSETGKLTDSQLGWLGLLGRVPSICVYVWRPSDWEDIVVALRRNT